MTTTPTDTPEGPHPSGPEARDLGRLRRSRTDRHIGGVAGGLARHFDVDTIIIRVALVVLVFFGGAGLLIYAACWLLVPEEGSDSAVLRLDERSRSFVLYVVAGLAVLALLGDTIGHFHLPWPFTIVAVIVIVVLAGRDRTWFGSFRIPRRRGAGSAPEATQSAAPSVAPEPAAYASDSPVSPVGAPITAPVVSAPNPRKRGPILFWFTLALIALGEGLLGTIDLAGASIAGPAYAGLAVGIIGLMLVLGAFWGRAGGLIFLGFVASVILACSLAADKWDISTHGDDLRFTPASAAAVRDSYQMGTGNLVVDLSNVADPADLVGRHLDVHGNVGHLEILVPADVTVVVDANVHGPGDLSLFGQHRSGIHTSLSRTSSADTQPLTVTADLKVGEIEVETR